MNPETLTLANLLTKEIDNLETLINNETTQPCEWIEFTFGNGSNRLNVCNDPEIILQVRELIKELNSKKLIRLKKQLHDL